MRYAFLTGISKGLGQCLAERFIERDYSILALGRTPNPELERMAQAKGLSLTFFKADLSDQPETYRAINEAFKSKDFKDAEALVLVNNAGTLSPVETLFSIDLDTAKKQLALNLETPIALSYLFCRKFRDTAVNKRIINISSRGALMPGAGLGMYCISKAGLDMLTKMIHVENLSERNPVHCVGVRPGALDTQMQRDVRDSDETPEETRQMFEKFVTEGLLRDPGDASKRIMELLIDQEVESGKTYELPGAGLLPK